MDFVACRWSFLVAGQFPLERQAQFNHLAAEFATQQIHGLFRIGSFTGLGINQIRWIGKLAGMELADANAQ